MRTEQVPYTPPEQDVLAYILENVRAFLRKNGLHIAVVVGVVLVVVVVYRTRVLRQQARSLSQWEAVGELAETLFVYMYQPGQAADLRRSAIERCREIIEKEPKTSATPWLLVELGSLLASGGEWAEAASAYRQVMAQYPEEEAARWAREGLAGALEEMGEYAEAAATYESLAAAGPGRRLADAGRCKELAGDADGAQEAYAKALDTDIPDDMRDIVEGRLVDLAQGNLLGAPPELKRLGPFGMSEPEPMTVPADTEAPAEAEGPADAAPPGPKDGAFD
ncbi:MAG: tetratricopeptide repeat protein [Candidatus Brocadiae bacterium]|nr:tetratricopeptide repeat protein [Candidatus Brocadiia bacterium]